MVNEYHGYLQTTAQGEDAAAGKVQSNRIAGYFGGH